MANIGEKPVEYLVVDTTAFIQNASLQNVAEKIVTCPEVVSEITNKRQLRRLVVLPYDLVVKEAFPENVQIITDFAKKTGDYPSLSATDIKVMALTYQLEKEKVGTDHLRSEPVIRKPIVTTKKITTNMNADVTGFYKPGKTKKIGSEHVIDNDAKDNGEETVDKESQIEEKDENNDNETEENDEETLKDVDCKVKAESKEDTGQINNKTDNSEDHDGENEQNTDKNDSEDDESDDDDDDFDEERLTEQLENLEMDSSRPEDEYIDSVLVAVKENADEEETNDITPEEQGDDVDDDNSGWITPKNIQIAKKQFNSEIMESKKVTVACMTTDFAMQNVLKQMNLNVSALDGRLIKQLRTFILRCYTCFKTTSIMTKKFCPKCGNNTLKKVAVSLDKNGKLKIHINPKHPLTARGKKYSLPKIKGGKHPNNPILVEDQPMPDNRPSRLARTKNNPLDDDYIAGFSPFVMRDVNSRSALLCIRPGQEFKYWMRKNPNEARKKRK